MMNQSSHLEELVLETCGLRGYGGQGLGKGIWGVGLERLVTWGGAGNPGSKLHT